ncbi:hypothetical protein TNCV_1124161 [Trichonephila clavipes]|uniref:Uncharacterized protein n=1 Tax=Trichonephila clavipes TaxID=2585209 RepID=A0A8X6VFN4_TRICX|nr:hypothetical protein TNCV_1124161 [Trichonephila clavipes]
MRRVPSKARVPLVRRPRPRRSPKRKCNFRRHASREHSKRMLPIPFQRLISPVKRVTSFVKGAQGGVLTVAVKNQGGKPD